MNTLNENQSTVYAGLDISKAQLQLHLQNTHHVLDNNPKGHAALLKKIRALGHVQIICEATGGYEKGIVAALHAAAQPVSVLNPALVATSPWRRDNAPKTIPSTAKSSPITAVPCAPRPRRRRSLRVTNCAPWCNGATNSKEQLARVCPASEHRRPGWITRQQKKLPAHLEKQMAAVEKECQKALARTPHLQEQVRQLEQLDAVGPVTALSVLSHLPELGTLNRQEAAALAGLAPWARQSGPWEGQRHIGSGRAAVRRALYMSAVGLVRMKGTTLGKFYARLRASGKPAKVALTAVMRKLLLQMNRVLQEHALKNQTPQPV